MVVALLPLKTTTEIPYVPSFYRDTDLQAIDDVSVAGVDGVTQRYVRIGAGTTNDQFRQWCLDKKTVCIPFNVIMVRSDQCSLRKGLQLNCPTG